MPGKLLTNALEPIADGESPDELKTSGYVVSSLQTALHDALGAATLEDAIVTAVNRGGVVSSLQTALHDALGAATLEDAIVTAVNRGGDADTIGAIAGAVAGARFGQSQLPHRWTTVVDETTEARSLADQLASRV
ncbi:ADP-ribosyl-(dinitrogen reductase) hydrolase [Haloferax elongans ATCC BAA-1513]|uniref:ADP-ribosyl-(Dinitrogen reductase) hydrolase n=1 Tax=Haloferax elongans ATCC BAA-1513 TaxID=1230453 RepID=M0HZC2_HALEO|nr:ADP-ribosyl-(dinitrogen reductase) hydrolase [Haloferax elongans ATCC BAA-1513]